MNKKQSKPEYEAELLEDSIRDTDENGNYPGQAEAELAAFMLTDEAQLAGFTNQQLNDEIARRLFEPYLTNLKKAVEKMDILIAQNSRPF